MSKGRISLSASVLLTAALPCLSYAALYDRGNGLIYDSVLNITWLQDVRYAQTSGADADGLFLLNDAKTWVSNLDYDGITGWRLPTLTPVGGGANFNVNTFSYDGSTDYGYNISYPGAGGKSPGFTGNELAYMFYVELGNLARYKPDGTGGVCQPSTCLVNASFIDAATGQPDSFKNLLGSPGFWTNIPPVGGFTFDFKPDGFNDRDNITVQLYVAWAVHDGDVAAPPPSPSLPEPSMRLLPITALLSMLALAGSRSAKSKR
jgi:hypothetical protein